MILRLDDDWYKRQAARTDALRAEQAAIPDPIQTEDQDFYTAQKLYQHHSEMHPKGTWFLARRSWKSMMFAHHRGEEMIYCRYFVTGQMAGLLSYTPEPITDAEKAEKDWIIERNLAWLDW